jgi:UDPglucose 6-dehydrogenase
VQAKAGLQVCGTDINGSVEGFLKSGRIPYQEEGVEETLASGFSVNWMSTIAEVVENSDVVYVAAQTPHAPEFEGCTPTPSDTKDFEYGFLISAVESVVAAAKHKITLIVVSTVLPGTCDRELVPLISRNKNIDFVYSPAFIAMGTTMQDYSNPEMVLVGTDCDDAFDVVSQIVSKIHSKPVVRISVIECEMVKMSYNTFIGMKIVFANAIGELCEKIGGNADNVIDTLSLATDRIISGKYLRPGLGDGGGCHPRDQLALSWLAKRVDLSEDIFGWLMRTRDSQTEWIANVASDAAAISGLPIRVLGKEYKPNTNLTIGSPSRLLMAFLPDGSEWSDENVEEPAVYVIGVKHDRYRNIQFPIGSYVLDPWGFIQHQDGVVVRQIGRH